MTIGAYHLVGETLSKLGVDTMFFLMGEPTFGMARSCGANGIRMIDVRHEQAAAMMANAYARLRRKPGLCMAASGPGVINLTTGLANALVDCAPVIAIGGSSPMRLWGKGSFQEIDQVAIMRPVTKWAARVTDAARIPTMLATAYTQAISGTPGPVYLDIPGDVIYSEVDETKVTWPVFQPVDVEATTLSSATIDRIFGLLRRARRPVIISGSGAIWSNASSELQTFVERTGVPFYTTPQGRGVVPDDHPFAFLSARSTALSKADLVLALGTRLNYLWGFGEPPRFAKDAAFIRVDVDPVAVATTPNLAIGVTGDLKSVLRACNERIAAKQFNVDYAVWRDELAAVDKSKQANAKSQLNSDATPIHPLRLCREVRDFIERDAVLVVDGNEILNYGRQSIPTFHAGHRLNSGPFGTMGVGLPFAIGAKAAMPDKQVLVLHGDGSFGLNAMELDTAIRHNLPVLVVISLNGGWMADPDRSKPGRDLGYTRFDQTALSLGCHAEFVERPDQIRPALERAGSAVASGRCAVVNVVTDWSAAAPSANLSNYARAKLIPPSSE